MEHIHAPSFRSWTNQEGADKERQNRTNTALEKMAAVVAWLLECPLPEGDGIGSVGGGHIQHSFSYVQNAPVPFVNAVALEKYINKVRFYCLLFEFVFFSQALSRLSGGAGGRQINIQNEEHIFCHSDISLDNFFYDAESDRVWMIDFQHVNILPRSFFSFHLHASHWGGEFADDVASKLNFPRSPQLNVLEVAADIILQSDNSSFGEHLEPPSLIQCNFENRPNPLSIFRNIFTMPHSAPWFNLFQTFEWE
ncbi:hypothetical protein DFH08DRAFT_880284 [Mycena albidolilacea]|uniref:Aminoglycoside phosphotransferase domain-containing protein n=1 Tax=Mycena albidolilacea TaxID=1033008 RepID=A0AAD7ELU9_9AGAR|nr:hypothetical protein DFH08DRAFT_880284 [Mycena albidolilacea]